MEELLEKRLSIWETYWEILLESQETRSFLRRRKEPSLRGKDATLEHGFSIGRGLSYPQGVREGHRIAQVEAARALYGDGSNGWTQAAVGKLLSVSQATVSRWVTDDDPLGWES